MQNQTFQVYLTKILKKRKSYCCQQTLLAPRRNNNNTTTMLRPSSSAPGSLASSIARPSTAPTTPMKNFSTNEWIAVPKQISPSSIPPVPDSMFSVQKKQKLPETAIPPTRQFDSRDRFVDDAVHINAVPRSKPALPSAAVQFDEIHKLYHDLLLSFYFQDDDAEGKEDRMEGKERSDQNKDQRQRQRKRRLVRRQNPRIAFLLKRLLPLVSQGLNELQQTTVYRQASLEKVLPQSTLKSSSSSTSFVLPPGGAVNWLARYLVRNNPEYGQDNVDGESLLHHRVLKKHGAILAQCLREYDVWQLKTEQREALEDVNLHEIWQSIDTNDDGTLDICEVGTALRALGFILDEKPEDNNNNNNENDSDSDGYQAMKSRMQLDFDEMKQLFAALDVDESGDIDFDEFVLGTTRWFAGREAIAKAIFDRNLHNHHETDAEDMANLLSSLARKRMIRSLQAANLDSEKLFRQIDLNHDGFLDMNEFTIGISKLATAIHSTSEQNQVIMILNRNALTLFSEIDTNGDGLISLDEFQTFVVHFLDRGIEDRARKAGKRIQQEHENQIENLKRIGTNSLADADQILAAQRVLLLACQTTQLGLFRNAVNQFQNEMKGDETDLNNEKELLTKAMDILTECISVANSAERTCSVAASDLIAAHNALSVAMNQPTAATQLADLKSTINRHGPIKNWTNKDRNRHHPNTMEVAIRSVLDARDLVNSTCSIVSSDGMPLIELLHKKYAILCKRHKKENDKKRKNDKEKLEHERLEIAMEAKRKRQAEERRRRKDILDNVNKEEAHLRDLEEEKRVERMRQGERKRVEEKRKIKEAMRKAAIDREDELLAAIKAAQEAEKEAARHAQERAASWDPSKSVFKGRGVGKHANFFDSDKTCQMAVALELERALSKPAVVHLINYPMEDQVKEVKKAMLEGANGTAARSILDIYRHYCLSGHHMFAMQKHGFDQFVSESGIADNNSRTATAHHLETTFVSSNMNTPGQKHGEGKRDRSLNRAEFIEALIRMGIQKYFNDGRKRSAAATTGEAVMRIIIEHILPLTAGKGVKIKTPICDSNELREKVLYTIQIDDVFRQDDRIEFLQHIFEAGSSQKNEGARMNIVEWMRFVRGVVGKDGGQNSKLLNFSELATKECFLLSRLTVVDQEKDGKRWEQLSFEDFLEALVRLTEIVHPETEDGRDDTEWDRNNVEDVAPRLDDLIGAIMFKYDRDGDGGVSHAEINHMKRHGRRATRFEV